MKSYLTPGIFFEELGLRYIGPIDGHDLDNMIKVLKSVKDMNTPVLLHVFTDKSKSISSEKHDSIKSYSISLANKNLPSLSMYALNYLYTLLHEKVPLNSFYYQTDYKLYPFCKKYQKIALGLF